MLVRNRPWRPLWWRSQSPLIRIGCFSDNGSWNVARLRRKIAVVYVNTATGQTHDCGDQHVDTSMRLLIDWITVEAAPGDWGHARR